MKKFRVTATLDIGYSAIIEAENEESAWEIANGENKLIEPEWIQTDQGHDWTLENIFEESES